METPQERAAKKLATNVGYTLDEANVPNLLFGWLAMGLAGARKICREVDFVIPDAKMPSAIAALVAAEYTVCANAECSELNEARVDMADPDISLVLSPNRRHSVPSAHVHMENGEYVLSLHKQSTLLWWLPELQNGPPAANDPDFMLSDDPRLPPFSDHAFGPWLSSLFRPVKILNPNSQTEALIMLFCRDAARNHETRVLWGYMMLPLFDGAGCPGVTKQLRPKFQRAWDCLNRRMPGLRDWEEMEKLTDMLARANELGPLVDGSTWTPPR